MTLEAPMRGASFLAEHSAQHAAAGAEKENSKKPAGYGGKAVIDDHGKEKEDQKVKDASKQSPQEFAVALPFSKKKSGQKGHKDIDTGDADRNDLFGKLETVQHQRQQKEQPCGQQIG